jgi:hypothetical protein
MLTIQYDLILSNSIIFDLCDCLTHTLPDVLSVEEVLVWFRPSYALGREKA